MESLFVHEVVIIIPIEQKEYANLLAAQVDPDVGGNRAFGAPGLSSDGMFPITHLVAITRATNEGLGKIKLLSAIYSWAEVYVNKSLPEVLNTRSLKIVESPVQGV